MPAKFKREDCPHEITLGKTISINAQEQKASEAKGYPVPDQVRLEWCIGCWSINPRSNHKIPTLLPVVTDVTRDERVLDRVQYEGR